MIKHIYIPNESDRRGAYHAGPMLCGVEPSMGGQYKLSVYEHSNPGLGNTWCPQCAEKTDLAILATCDLGGEGSEDGSTPYLCGTCKTQYCAPKSEYWNPGKYRKCGC